MGGIVAAMSDEWEDPGYPRRVGERLRDMRRQKNLSLQAVEGMSGKEFKASVLGAYERGERSISVPRLQRLASIYNVPVDQLLPRVDSDWATVIDLSANEGALEGRSTEGGITIDLSRLDEIEGPERDLLRRYVGSIQVQRQDFNGRVLTIRAEDIKAIGRFFDLSPEAMRGRLEALGLSRATVTA